MRCGLVALVGRPNVGKSTLLNALLGRKLAIMSDRPQTTRSVIRGVLHRPGGQLVLVDTPGLHKPQTLLGRRLNDLVRGTLAEVDVACLLVDAAAGVGRGDRFLAGEVGRAATTAVCVVNKTDAAGRAGTVTALTAASALADWADVVPVSARTGEQLDVLVEVLLGHLPERAPLYPPGHVSDEPEEHLIAELIREQALGELHDELPHSLAVVVDELEPGEREDVLVVRAILFVERASQKPIVLGRGGTLLREVGTRARHELEALLGTRVYLDLRVKTAKDWQRDPRRLARMGF